MKTRKESKTKSCSKCGEVHKKKAAGVWTVKFPYWICHKCALAANLAMQKLGRGKIKEGVSDLVKLQFGGRVNLEATGRKLGRKRQKVYDKLKREGFSDDEIKAGWKAAGWDK